MAEIEEEYLRQCLEQNICPVCQQSITKKFGTGQFKDGVFFTGLPRRMEQGIAGTTTSRQDTEE